MANETKQTRAGSDMAAGSVLGTPLSLIRSLTRKSSVGHDLWRIHGASKFIGQILPWAAHRRYFFYEGSLARDLPGFKPQVPEVRVAPAAPSDLPLLLKARPGYYSLVQLQDRLKQGHACFLSRVGSEPVNIRWAFVGSVYLSYLSRTLILAPDEFYFDELFTAPRWRHRGIDQQTFRFMRTWFRDRCFKKQYCLLTSWDVHLQKRYEANHMVRTGEVQVRPWPASNRLVLEGRIQDLGQKRIAAIPRKLET